MPRNARAVAVDVPHHITQRGNNRQNIFFEPDDYHFYLSLLQFHLQKFKVEMLGYTLMTNHIHEILIPQEPDSLANALGRAHSRYTQYINSKYRRSGHLWQNRFFSCPMDHAHLWTALCYVERNPVRAGMVKQAWDYGWSSAEVHISGRDSTGLLSMKLWQSTFTPAEWRRMLEQADDPKVARRLREATLRGRPFGSESYLREMENHLGRPLHANPSGRPKK